MEPLKYVYDPNDYSVGAHQGVAADPVRMHPHRPTPDLATGYLEVDPEIRLKARGFDLNVAFHYSSRADQQTEYGYGRSATVRAYALSAVDSKRVTIVRGDFNEAYYDVAGSSGGVTTFTTLAGSGVLATLTYSGGDFVERFPDGMQLVYHSQVGGTPVKHELVRVADARGNAQTYVYGTGAEAGLLKSIEVPGGGKVTLTYGAGGPVSLVSGIEDWAGRRWTLQYDASHCLTTLTAPLGCSTRFGYSLAGGPTTMLQWIEDPRGYRTSYQYNSQRQVVSMIAGTATWEYQYGSSSPQTVVISPTGARQTHIYDNSSTYGERGNLIAIQRPEGYTVTMAYLNRIKVREETPAGVQVSLTYDTGLWLVTASDDALGYRTTLQRDAYGNVTTLVDAEGKVTTFGFDGSGATRLRTRMTDPLGRVTSWTHDAYGQMLTATDPRGLTITYTWDSQGNLQTVTGPDGKVTTFTHDSLGRQTSVTDPLGHVTTTVWDDGDNRVAVVDPLGNSTTTIYDACLAVAVVNPLGYRTSWTHDRFGNRLTETDANGNVASWTYDNMGYPVSAEDASGHRTTRVYNDARQVLADIDQTGNSTSYVYDASNRRVAVQDPLGNVTTQVLNARGEVTAVVDALGNRTSFTHDKVGRQVGVQDPLGYRVTQVYDDAGQATVSIDAMGRSTTTTYDAAGNRETVTDPNGHWSTLVYEANSNRVAARVNALGYAASNSYDDAGRLAAIQDARGNRTSFGYDAAGRLVTQVNAQGQVATNVYDAAGQRTAAIDPAGHAKTYTYDPVGLVTGVAYHDGSRVTQQYDAVGRLTTQVDAVGTATFTYSARGELVGTSLPGGYNLSMDYDAVGNRTGLTDPDGGRFTAVYDALNRLDCLVDPDAKRTTLQYDAGGRRTTLVDGNGVTRAYQYDPAGRPTTQVDYNSGMSPFYTMVDGYDNAGNRTTRQQNGYLWTWVYDVADQLLQQLRSGYRGTYTYDEAGNITLKDHQGYSPITMAYDACNRLTTVQRGTTLETLTYGDSGNLAVDNSNGNRVTYAWDPENRLLSMHNYTGSRYTYAYWADGLRRYAQEPSSPIVTQIWDGQDLLMEKSPTGTARYIAHEGEVFGEKRGDARYLYLPDPLGSVVAMVDNAQAITDSFIYLPYGEEQSRTGSTASNLRWLGRWGYRRDYTNRAYVRARVMRTDFGKWMTEDPLGFGAGDVNLYRYVGGNPLTQVDPGGMWAASGGECDRYRSSHTSADCQGCCEEHLLPILKKRLKCVTDTMARCIHDCFDEYRNDREAMAECVRGCVVAGGGAGVIGPGLGIKRYLECCYALCLAKPGSFMPPGGCEACMISYHLCVRALVANGIDPSVLG